MKTSAETTFTQIGTTGIFYRKVNPFLVEIKFNKSMTITANTNYALAPAGTLPAEIRPVTAQSLFISIRGASGYNVAVTSGAVGADGSIGMTGQSQAGIMALVSGIYCLI